VLNVGCGPLADLLQDHKLFFRRSTDDIQLEFTIQPNLVKLAQSCGYF
jgi:hypothetical protein